MKPRRKLERGEKIVFEDGNGNHVTAYVLKCHDDDLSSSIYTVTLAEYEPCTINNRSIHRLQVVKTFKKVKKKPLIVWTNQAQLDWALARSGSIYGGPSDSLNIPLRPLTKREREKWGV